MNDPIAITGIGCRFPGAKGPESFWRLLSASEDAITEIPPIGSTSPTSTIHGPAFRARFTADGEDSWIRLINSIRTSSAFRRVKLPVWILSIDFCSKWHGRRSRMPGKCRIS